MCEHVFSEHLQTTLLNIQEKNVQMWISKSRPFKFLICPLHFSKIKTSPTGKDLFALVILDEIK